MGESADTAQDAPAYAHDFGDWGEGLEPAQRRWLSVYAVGMSLTEACRIARVSRSSVYRWREESEEFARAFELARKHALEELESLCLSRARDKHDDQSGSLIKFVLERQVAGYAKRTDVNVGGEVPLKVVHAPSMAPGEEK